MSYHPSKRYVSLNIAADMVSKFDGKTPSVLSFIRACRSAEKAIHPGDKEFLITMVRNKIIGNADLYLQNNIEPDSMDSLLEAIKSAFSPPNDLSQLQAQISNVMQSNNESVLHYGIRVSEFLRHTLDAIEEGFPTEAVAGMKLGATQNAISCFIRGLKENIETRITTRKADSLQAIINVAVAIETEVECSKNLRGSKKSEMPPRSHPYMRDNVRNRNEYHQVRKIEGYQGQSEDMRKCFNCEKTGHFKKDCPKLTNDSQQQKKDVRVLIRCGFCGAPNHYEENCLAKKSYLIKKGLNFPKSSHKGAKEKTGQNYVPKPGPSTSNLVGSFAPSTQQK